MLSALLLLPLVACQSVTVSLTATATSNATVATPTLIATYNVSTVAGVPFLQFIAGNSRNFAYIDGPASQVQFGKPFGIAMDSKGNVYFADLLTHSIRKFDNNGTVVTFAGSGAVNGSSYTSGFKDGQGAEALFNAPVGICIDNFGNLYVTDSGNVLTPKVVPHP
jgi:streptogramin lyase